MADDVPVLGVNMGRLGYLSQIEPSGLEQALKAFLAGEHEVEDRMTLQVTLTDEDGTDRVERLALNEASVEKDLPGHTVRIATSIRGRPFMTYEADGLLVATPTGSTAYNLSARGPVLSPGMRALVLTPVSPHMQFDRSLVLDPSEWVALDVLEPRSAVLVIDGFNLASLKPGCRVTCPGRRPACPPGHVLRSGLPRHPPGQVPPGRPVARTGADRHAVGASGAEPRGDRRRHRDPRTGDDRPDR